MIIPIGHEQDTVRRLPWITFGIMGICFLALALSYGLQSDLGAAEDAFDEAISYFMEHPYLELPPEFEKLFFDGVPEDEKTGLLAFMRSQSSPPSDTDLLHERQAELYRLCERAIEMADTASPWRRFGLIPAQQDATSWITHMFMHGDWIHLFFNMLILYLAGPFIEDVWGRGVYAGFYLTAGLFASLVFVLREPDLAVPLVGASGAIAGVMGAFLVRYWNTKIRFFYIFGLIFRGTFDAPAWLMLPMWFCEQLVMASLSDHVGGSGVAYWAHVGGFVFGVAVALAIRHLRIEETHILPAIEAKTMTTVVANPAVEHALELQAAGNDRGALDLLAEEVRKDPRNRDAALAMWSLGEEQGLTAFAAPALIALIRDEVRCGEKDLAVGHWRELITKAPGSRPDPNLIVRLAQILKEQGAHAEAAAALRLALLEGGTSLPVATALRIATHARSLDPRISQGAVQLALANPDLVPMEREQAMEILESCRH